VDPVDTQCAFAEKIDAPFPLLSDTTRKTVAAYGVPFEIRGMKLAARSVFVVAPDGKIAWLDRKYAVPQTLEGSDLLGALDRVADHRIEAAVKDVKDPETKALRLLFLRGVEDLLTGDAVRLAALLEPAKEGAGDGGGSGGKDATKAAAKDAAKDAARVAAKKMIAAFELEGSSRPFVLDLVDPGKITISLARERPVEVAASIERAKPTRVAFPVVRTDDGYRIVPPGK
jgi:hypothetical protein